jgi:hypothetical protein
MTFDKWLDVFVAEKGLDTEIVFNAPGDAGTNWVPLGAVVEFVKTLDAPIKAKIKATIVKIDFINGDVLDFFKYMAKGMAI